jgi:hypothetical protein
MRTIDMVSTIQNLDIQISRMNIGHYIILGLAVFYPLEEFIEKWIPRGFFYEAIRYGSEIILISLLIWVTVTRSFLSGRWKSTPIDIPLFLLLLFSLLSSLFNDLPISLFLLGIRPFIRFVTVFYIIVQLGYNRMFSERFAQFCIITASTISLIAILQSIIGFPATNFLLPENVEFGGEIVRAGTRGLLASRTRVFSTLGRYDTLGTYLTIIFLLITSLYWIKSIPKKYYYLFVLFSIPAMLLSYSRQSWLATTIGVVILMIIYKKYRNLVAIGIVFIGGILVILLFLSRYSFYSGDQAEISLINRLLEPFSQRYLEISRFNYGRLFVIFDVSSRILARAPLLGFGPGNFGSLTARFFGRDFSSLIDIRPESAYLINDVNWVTLLGQIGLIGVFLFGSMLFLMILRSRNKYKVSDDLVLRGYAGSLIAIVFVFVLMGFFGPNFEVRQVSFFVWSIAGIVFSFRLSDYSSSNSIKINQSPQNA